MARWIPTHGLQRTRDHDRIRAWVDSHDARPARVRGSTDTLAVLPSPRHGDDLSLTDHDADELDPISWGDWFDAFDAHDDVFVFESPGYDCKVVRHGAIDDLVHPPAESLASHVRRALESIWPRVTVRSTG
jgi:hypothetical protein